MKTILTLMLALATIGCGSALSPTAPTTPSTNLVTLHWDKVAPGCMPRPHYPTLGPQIETKLLDNGQLQVWWEAVDGDHFYIHAEFTSVAGEWLLCEWDTMG